MGTLHRHTYTKLVINSIVAMMKVLVLSRRFSCSRSVTLLASDRQPAEKTQQRYYEAVIGRFDTRLD